jgi:iron uptake system component EfeO
VLRSRTATPARAIVGTVAALSATLLLAACGSSSATSAAAAGSTVVVQAADASCTLSTREVPAGTTTFSVQNTGSSMNEFYLYDGTGATIVTELENIGPGITKQLVAQLDSGTYTTSCRPNGTGMGIRANFTVAVSSGGASSAAASADLTKAVATYRAFIGEQTAALLPATAAFVAAVKADDVAKAKKLYAPARAHYEAIEPVAESFSDLDTAIDIRENDVTPGEPWTGWHRLEKELWTTNSTAGLSPIADKLLADTKILASRIPTLKITPSSIGNGASGLMEEVSTLKVTGEENRYSHTDLSDFDANIVGAKAAFQALEPAVTTSDLALATRISTGFASVEAELAKYQRPDGTYPLYPSLTSAQIAALAASVNALSEPLSKLTAAVVS